MATVIRQPILVYGTTNPIDMCSGAISSFLSLNGNRACANRSQPPEMTLVKSLV